MNDWIQYILPLPAGSLLRSAYTWLCDAVFWGVFAVYAGALFYSIVFSAFAEKENKSFVSQIQNAFNTKLFRLAWAPFAIALFSGVSLALQRLGNLEVNAMHTGILGFALGLGFMVIGYWIQNISVIAHAKGPTQSGKEQGLKFSSPAYLYTTYASLMSFLAGSLLFVGTELWCMDEKLWSLGYFGAFSSLQTWFMWFMLLCGALMISALVLIKLKIEAIQEERNHLQCILSRWTQYSAYTLPLCLVAGVFAINLHALSLVVVVFSILTLIASYAVWHLNLHLAKSKTFFAPNLGFFALILTLTGLLGATASYGVRETKLSQQKQLFNTDLKLSTYLDTMTVDSNARPVPHEKSPYGKLQLKHY